ncbi:MAG: HAD-IA family hydrolase [Chloroflexi bacterium]|nr:HAD-IA family hydrolase [Chloroflexota bacterium]
MCPNGPSLSAPASALSSRKPDPRIFEIALTTLGVSPRECVFVDDRWANVEAAARLGITALHFVPHIAPSDAAGTQVTRLMDTTRWLTPAP